MRSSTSRRREVKALRSIALGDPAILRMAERAEREARREQRREQDKREMTKKESNNA